MSDAKPVIRTARAADAPGLAACIDAAYAPYQSQIADLPPVSEGCDEDIANNQVWVVDLEGQIICGLVLVPQDGFLKLANLAVHPDHAGKGLGRRLIELAQHEATRQGHGELRLNTHVQMPRNVSLYRHMGWVEVLRRGNTVSMVRHLTGT